MKPGTPEFETRLRHLREGLKDTQHDGEENTGEESPGTDLAVQSRVDSVQLAKGRLSTSSGETKGKGSHSKQPPGERSQLPPAGGKSRLASSDKQTSGTSGKVKLTVKFAALSHLMSNPSSYCSTLAGIANITRKLRSSIGMSRKEKQDAGEEPAPLQHVQFDDHIEHLPGSAASREASP